MQTSLTIDIREVSVKRAILHLSTTCFCLDLGQFIAMYLEAEFPPESQELAGKLPISCSG